MLLITKYMVSIMKPRLSVPWHLVEFEEVIHNWAHGSCGHYPRGWERRAGSCCGRCLSSAAPFPDNSSSEEKAAAFVDQAIAASSTASESRTRLPDRLDGRGNSRFGRGHLRPHCTTGLPAVHSLQTPVSNDSSGDVCPGQAGRSDSSLCGQVEAQKLLARAPLVPRCWKQSGGKNRILPWIACRAAEPRALNSSRTVDPNSEWPITAS
jgi:hypothetical protein